MVLAPLLMTPVARADEFNARVEIVVNIVGELGWVTDPNLKLSLQTETSTTIQGTVRGMGSLAALGGITPYFSSHCGSQGGETSAASCFLVIITLFQSFVLGDIVDLKGVVSQSSDPDLLQTPVEITAYGSLGQVGLSLGPVLGGPFAGELFAFFGTGMVTIIRICPSQSCQTG